MDQVRLVKALDTLARYAQTAKWSFIQAAGMAFEEGADQEAVSYDAQAHAIDAVAVHAAEQAAARRPENMALPQERNKDEFALSLLKPKLKAARDARESARLAGKVAIDAVIEAHALGEPQLAHRLLESITALYAVPGAELVAASRASYVRAREYQTNKESKSA